MPSTTRIECQIGEPKGLNRREVSPDLSRMAFLHYSAFLHLFYANKHLAYSFDASRCDGSEFGDFYSHAGSVCDLVEDFLLRIFLTVLKCRGEASATMQRLTRDQFCEIAGRWYDDHYANVFEHYSSKGKIAPVRLPSRSQVLDEYLGDSKAWKRYKGFSQQLREYRNVIVHDVVIGQIVVPGGPLVPKKKVIQQYRGLLPVFEAVADQLRMKRDFVSMHRQMAEDFETLQWILNDLWNRPITDLTRLFYEERNTFLLHEYRIILETIER